MKLSWTRNDIRNRYELDTRDTRDLWPTNDIPRRCDLEFHCTFFGKTEYPCNKCNSYTQDCKFKTSNLWQPIVYVWQLEYMLQNEIVRLKTFLGLRTGLVEAGFVSERP